MNQRMCIECKSIKPYSDFEIYGKTFRRICRACRGKTITGITVNNLTTTVQNAVLDHSIPHLENKFQVHINIVEQQLNHLKSINLDLLSQNNFLLQQNDRLFSNIEDITSRLEDVVVICRDPSIQDSIININNDIKALSNSVGIIYQNTKPIRTTSPPISPIRV